MHVNVARSMQAYSKWVSASGAPLGLPLCPACLCESFLTFKVAGFNASVSFLQLSLYFSNFGLSKTLAPAIQQHTLLVDGGCHGLHLWRGHVGCHNPEAGVLQQHRNNALQLVGLQVCPLRNFGCM